MTVFHYYHKDDNCNLYPIKALCRNFTETEWRQIHNTLEFCTFDSKLATCEACVLIAMVQPELCLK